MADPDITDALTHEDVFYLEEVAANLRAFVEAGRAGDFLKDRLIEYCDGADRLAAKLRDKLPPD